MLKTSSHYDDSSNDSKEASTYARLYCLNSSSVRATRSPMS